MIMSNTYHYSLCIILLIFGDLKGFVRTRIITKFLAHIVTICAKGLGAYRVDTVQLKGVTLIEAAMLCYSFHFAILNHTDEGY